MNDVHHHDHSGRHDHTDDHDGGPARADALVMLGIAGDLGEQQLFPALVELALDQRLDHPVVGVGRSERTDDEVRELVRTAAREHDGVPDPDELVDGIDIAYVSGDATDRATYDAVARRITGAQLPVVYAALPPHTFGDVARAVAGSDLPDTTRLVLEKPFGTDATDARRLYDDVTEQIDADRLFIVDHFLAKTSIENLLTFRCANPMIDALMHNTHVDRIDVTMAEAFGVDGRESFYDRVGALADVVQNHLLQLVAVLTMEPPADGSDDAYDCARARLIDEIRPLTPDDVVLGQFEGYTDDEDVPDDSTTETYAAVRLAIDNDRWRGVPIVVRTGKRLAETRTDATVVFEGGAAPNTLRFGIKPDTAIELSVGVLDPEAHDVRPVTLTACAPDRHGPLGDYATMLLGAIHGDRRHFARIDGIEAAWRVIDPIRGAGIEPDPYAPGSAGPARAAGLGHAS